MKRLSAYLPQLAALFGVAMLSCSSGAHAQWSSDASDNLIVSDLAGGSTQPKMVPTPDGGFYVSWFGSTAGFDIYLQRLDAQGNELWPHDGILIADRNYGFTYDYGLAVDADGNALVSFNCCENNSPTEHIVVNKVTPDGTLPWGANGITVSTAAETVYNALVTATTDGDAVVAWTADSGVRAQKLDAAGNSVWTDGGVVLDQPASALKLLGGLQAAEDGDAIASWSNQSGSARILYAQKLAAADGAAVWDGGVRVFGEGNLQSGYFPPFSSDGAGGGVFWDYDVTGVTTNARVQHLDSGGNALLGANGALATTDVVNEHTDTAASFDPQSGDIYVAWRDNFTDNGGHTFDGVSAQRIDAAGNRSWGDTGKVLVPLTDSTDSTFAISQVTALPTAGGFLAGWATGAIPAADQPITISRLDASGNYVWSTPSVNVKTSRYSARTVGAISTNGYAAYAWQDGDDGAGVSTIRAQNLNLDGTLGMPSAAMHTLGGTLEGLLGSGLVLQVNGGDDLALSADGSFVFPTPLAQDSTYAVSVMTQPSAPAQTCTIANGDGTIGTTDVTDVVVTCMASDSIFANGFE
jgi:hypothetical protein